jgi:hypothetical protein
MPRQVVIPAKAEQTYYEEIYEFSWSLESREMRISICKGHLVDGEFVLDPALGVETLIICGEDYADLMADGGNGKMPGKPKGEFRKSDLYQFIDNAKLRNPHRPVN